MTNKLGIFATSMIAGVFGAKAVLAEDSTPLVSCGKDTGAYIVNNGGIYAENCTQGTETVEISEGPDGTAKAHYAGDMNPTGYDIYYNPKNGAVVTLKP